MIFEKTKMLLNRIFSKQVQILKNETTDDSPEVKVNLSEMPALTPGSNLLLKLELAPLI